MRGLKRASLLLFVLLFAGFACDLSSLDFSGQNPEATSLAQTLSAILTASQPAVTLIPAVVTPTETTTSTAEVPNPTAIATLTQTLTLTPYLTPTPMPIYTPTPVVPMITVSVPTNCRIGPGIPYDIVGALLPGEFAQVLAVDPTHAFYYIPNPDSPGDYCWVWGRYATITGSTNLLPIYTPPPSPTPTNTATPAPGFDLSFDGLVSCPGAWWLQYRLKNTGQITFQSIGMIVNDAANSNSASLISDSFFDQSDCSTTSTRAQLLPGKAVTVSPIPLGYDPSGHKFKVTVTLCSQDGQNGMCETRTITIKP